MGTDIYSPRTVARVEHVSSDHAAAYLQLRNGTFVTYTPQGGVDLSRGDVVFISEDWDDIEPAPRELWPEEPWVGVVRVVKHDKVVVDISGRLKILPTPNSLALAVGNTVEGLDSAGITGLLSHDPVRYLDLPTVDAVTIEQFKLKPRADISFDDFGGFPEIVKRARELIELPLEHHDQLKKIGTLPIKGVLFTGDPGTGKTMLARIIANQTDAQFYLISGPQVLSKWYGQSEELVRKIFEDAARQARAIIVFDEIDSLAAQRGDDTHEASRRIVGQLLTSMDGVAHDKNNIVVVATTNRRQDIDVALLRPGRFDWEIHFPEPSEADRQAILAASTRGLSVADDLPHTLIAAKTDGWSPAELAAIWKDAALLAAADKRGMILAEDYRGGFERVSRKVALQRCAKQKVRP